jgi:hypothetical protein
MSIGFLYCDRYELEFELQPQFPCPDQSSGYRISMHQENTDE